MPRIHHVVVQPTPFCNINCSYCYLPDRTNKAVMAEDTVADVFARIFESGWCEERINIIWHAGEPLVLPPSYYRRLIEVVAERAPPGLSIQHSLNTNATLLNAEWCAFFKENAINVGVSIDGPQALHDANRKTRAGQGTHAKALAGLRLLRQHDVPFYVISVLTREALRRPEEMYRFYRDEDIYRVCFNIEEVEGVNDTSSMLGAEVLQECDHFFRTFWNLMMADGNKLWVREFSSMFREVLTPNPNPVRALVEPFVHLNVDWQGNFSTFSPELLGIKSASHGDFVLGNLRKGPLSASNEKLLALQAEIADGVDQCRQTCSYFDLCGGGAPSNKLAENGTFASGETMYCRVNVMTMADIVLDIVDVMAAEGASMDVPAEVTGVNSY